MSYKSESLKSKVKNNKKLLVVESPTKARTIGRYLSDEFQVMATVGHLRDLPKSKMAVDLTTFEPEYVISEEKRNVVNDLIKAAAKAASVILATDPDREGEAIAWHVKYILKNDQAKRIVFHEITKEAVEEALKNAREIDINLVDAQQGRRVLDRVVGYSLSPILWKKVRRGLSAGRVQSVAVRLIVEREREIEKFRSEKYFKVIAELEGGFGAELVKIDKENFYVIEKLKLFDGFYSFSKTRFTERNRAEKFVAGLEQRFKVEKIIAKEISRVPPPAFTTSKLQQAAARRFGWSGKQTMSVAQKLYEKGLITYHRTDSVYLSNKAIEQFRKYIAGEYGEKYLSAKVRVYRNSSKNAQEAHEAIRPVRVEVKQIDEDSKENRLYDIVWKRAVATQAAAARMMSTTIDLSNKEAIFRASGVRMLFEGFLRISGEKHEDQILPELKEGQMVSKEEVRLEELETSPPPRYTDALLVSSLEKQGIGRPSTYAPIISTIQLRQYVEKEEGKFKPTALGIAANDFLVKNFESILSLPFTAKMEENLDEISLGKLEWKRMMKDFYGGFKKELDNADKNGERVKVETEKLGEKCPECKTGDLVIRVGRFGKFISCNRFPECRYTRQFKEAAGFKCPKCGADGVVRRTRTGRKFYGCASYPKCKWAGWKKP